jgi:hypothetical protein
MLYSKRTVRCAARGLSREEAKLSLEHQFAGSEVLDVKRRGDKWVATLLEPKTAEFPPKDDEDTDAPPEPKAESDDEGPKDSSSESDDSPKSDGPPKGDKPPGKGGEKAEIGAVLDLLTAIADKLGIAPPGAVPGAEDPLSPDGPPPPPPGPPGAGGPPGGPDDGVGGPGHQEIVHRTKLKPGDTPPGVTPIGAPAFASSNLSRMASFDAFDDTPGKSIKQAKAELEELYGPHGFKVRQIKRVEGGRRLAAKLSRR